MESELREAVFSVLKAFADAEGWPIFFPNKGPSDAFLKSKTPHVRSSILPIEQFPLMVCDGSGPREWILQNSLFVRAGDTEIDVNEMVDKVVDLLPCLRVFTGASGRQYKLVRRTDPKPPIPSDGWYQVPIDSRVQTFT